MKTYVIAEVGPNHNGNVDLALKYVKELSKIGCSAIKFQHGRPELIYSNQAFFPDYQNQLKEKYIDPILASKKRLLTDKDHVKIHNECKSCNIDYLCSAFDLKSIKFLNENTNMRYFKIPSGEILSLDILDYVRSFDKPILLSTGMATNEEIEFSINFINKFEKKKIILLHCISSYPTKNKDINLNRINKLKNKFGLKVGLSDHTSSLQIASFAVYMGANVIEKHVTFDKNDEGPDHKTSLNIKEFKNMITNIKEAEEILGPNIRYLKKDEKNVKSSSRKSLTAYKDIKKGQRISKSLIAFKRPGNGISPIYLDKIISMQASKSIKKNMLIKWSDLKELKKKNN